MMNPGIKHSTYSALLLCIVCVCGMKQVFRKQPVNSSSVEGERTFIECEVEALSGQVQWVRDGLLLGPGRSLPGFPRYRVIGNSSAGIFNLQIDNVQLEDDASYQCQVGQSRVSAGIISRTVRLDVLIPPMPPIIQEVNTESTLTWIAGKEYSLTCHAQDSKPTSSITFTKSGVELFGSETTVMPGSKAKLYSTVSTIRITPEDTDNGNDVVCGALNLGLTQPRRTSFTMNILYPPELPTVEGYSQGQVKAGEVLQLICTSIGGNPLAALRWLKGDVVLSQEWETDVSQRTARSSLTYKTKPEDNGVKLMCEALNQVTANPLRKVIILHVVFPPLRVMILGVSRTVEGKDITLSCVTTGSNPPATVRWWAAGKELNVTEVTYRTATLGGVITVSNMSLTTSRQDNGMSLMCEAVNEAVFQSRSANTIIQVYYPPERTWIDGPPATTPFRTGMQVTFTCFVTGGNPPARLVWKKGSKPVMKAVYKSTGRLASSELTIMTVPSDNQAIYQCHATNIATPTPFTTITRIWVQFAPIDMRITASAEQVHQGDIVTLTCTVGSANPVAQVAWIKDGVRMEAEQVKIQKAEYGGHSIRAELSVIAMSSDNGQRVFCEGYSLILNEARSTFLRLNVLHAPEFLRSQVGIVFGHERGAVIIPIEISANPSEVTYIWSKNGQQLVKDGPTRHHLRVDGSLEIWNLTRYDAGLYRINVRNQEGGSERMLTLDVKYSPQISHITDPAEVDLGGRIELICTTDTNPVISNMVTWRRTGDGREVTPSDQVFLNETTKLVIAGAKRGDAGSYECSADNGIPPVATARAQLIVRFKPEIQKGVDLSKVAVVGDGTSMATLNCKAEGIPDVEFYWAKHGVTLDPNHPRYLQTILHEGALHTAELSVVNASAALDYATFTCTAQNPLGLDTFDIHLVSISRPDPPTGLSVLSKSHNSVTLAWNQGFNGGLEQTFQIRYTSAETLSYLYADVYPAQAMSFTITGLRAQTAYNFSVGALNTLGSSDYTDVLNVITSDQGQPFPTETLTIPELKPAGGFLIPIPIFFPLLVLALLLLFLNVGIIAGLIHRVRQRGTGGGMEKSASPRVRQFELNDYCDEVVNVTSRQTLLIDTESELCSTTYESYDDSASPFTNSSLPRPQKEEAPGQRRRLRSTNDIIPRAFSLQEPAEWARRQVPNGPGYGVSNAERIFPNLRQEAGLKDQAIYEDVSDETDLWPGHHTHCLEPNQHRIGSHPGMILSGAFPASFAVVSPLADYDEPSELWGELV